MNAPRRLLSLVLGLYLLITVAYSIVNPLFEAPDEHWHFFTAVYIAETGRLPRVETPPDPWLSQEAAQPPLYYLLGAALIAPLDTANARDEVLLNPFASVGNADDLTNLNRAIHGDWEAWPWRGYVLAAHLLRLFGTALGLGTLLCIYGSGRLLWPPATSKALLATALVAFLPQFNFLHASITNDTLIVFLSAAAIWQILALIRKPYPVTRNPISLPDHRPRTTGYGLIRYAALGITIGLAALSKTTGVLLLVFAIGVTVLLWLWQRTGGRAAAQERLQVAAEARVLLARLLALVVPVLLLAGWLWWRNWTLYGDPTAANQFVLFAGGDRGYTVRQVLAESGGLWKSLFAVFGWFNVRPPQWIYWVWNLIVLTAVAGGVKSARDNRLRFDKEQLRAQFQSPAANLLPALVLLAWALIVYGGLVAFLLQTEAAQGRLLFPALVPLAAGLAAGLTRWRHPLFRQVPPLLALVITLYCLLFVIHPVYTEPPLLETLPSSAASLGIDMGQGLRLAGAEVETETAVPGQPLAIMLYWQSTNNQTAAIPFKVEVFGQNLEQVGNLHSYHGRGLYPNTLWPEGAIVADRFQLYLDSQMGSPVLAQIFVRLVAEEAPSVRAGTVKVVPQRWPDTTDAILAQIGPAIQLNQATLSHENVAPGNTLHIGVIWQTTAAPAANLTTLVHLAPAGQPPLAQGDRPPLRGDYPTQVWEAGEVIEDTYEIEIPAGIANGRYPVWIGMYDSNTLVRQPLSVNGSRQPDDAYLAGWINVHSP